MLLKFETFKSASQIDFRDGIQDKNQLLIIIGKKKKNYFANERQLRMLPQWNSNVEIFILYTKNPLSNDVNSLLLGEIPPSSLDIVS